MHWVVLNAALVATKLLEIKQKSMHDSSSETDAQWRKLAKKSTFVQNFCDRIVFSDEILLRGIRIVMPEALRNQTFDLAHEGQVER